MCQSELTEFLAELTKFAKNSMSSLLRNSTLETVFRPFPREVFIQGSIEIVKR